jgi:O-antigen ligase
VLAHAPVGALSLILAVVAASHGGYSPVSWAWTSLALLSLAVLALLLAGDVALRARELIFLVLLVALLGWTLLSATWSSSAMYPIHEAQRVVVYVAACLAILLVTRSYRLLLAGTWAAISVICLYGLATRLFPTRLGVFDSIAGYRLSEPIGYWNGLGIFAAMGILLALGLVLRGTTSLLRVTAGASTVVLMSTLYFTFSRGAWISLVAGLVVLLALERRRLHALLALLFVGPWSAVGIWIASESDALTQLRASLPAAAADGRRVAYALAGLALGAGLGAELFAFLARRVEVPRLARRAFVAALVLAAVGALVTVGVLESSPPTLARRAYDAFVQPTTFRGTDLDQRYFRLSAGHRIPQWHAAWTEYRSHPWLGAGAGSYQSDWLRHRTFPGTVKDAHNLYLETLSELGPVGLTLLLFALVLPLVACVRRRGGELVSAACGAYVAYLVNAAGEWDWELPAITLAALFIASALLLASRRRGDRRRLTGWPRAVMLGGALTLVGFAVVALVGNNAVSASAHAAQLSRAGTAESQARKAIHWMPWSSTPWERLADAQLLRGETKAAAHSLRRAIAKEPQNWYLWYRLGLVTSGRAQQHALAVASRLNPLSPELESLRRELGVRLTPGRQTADTAP